MLSTGLPALPSVIDAAGIDSGASQAQSTPGSFLSLVDSALQDVSRAQDSAAASESAFAVGAPGSSLEKALVSSDQAEIAWNATVAVRNEVVSAYQSIMSMQF